MTRGRPFIDGRPSKLIVLCPDVCGVGWDFRMGGVAEAASRLWNGMRFPVGGLCGNRIPFRKRMLGHGFQRVMGCELDGAVIKLQKEG